MKLAPDCYECLRRLIRQAADLATDNDSLKRRAVEEAMNHHRHRLQNRIENEGPRRSVPDSDEEHREPQVPIRAAWAHVRAAERIVQIVPEPGG